MKNIFTELCKKYTIDKELIESLWQEIEVRYNEPHRHYHTTTHLAHLFETIQPLKSQLKNWDTILFSIFYHDIIYDIKSNKNEEESAIFANEQLNKLEVTKIYKERVIETILATKYHNPNKDNDIKLFLDADLAILGSETDIYQNYIENIRKEYSTYNDITYYNGREKVLEHFISQNSLYNSDFFYSKLEKNAQYNIKEEYKKIKLKIWK